jgi:hypothetical protein
VLIGRALVAIAAIDRLAAVGLKGNLRVDAAACANGIIHGTLWTSVSTSAIATTTAVLFGGSTAGLALSGWLKALGFVKFALFFGKFKYSAACSAHNIHYRHRDLIC